MKRRDFITLVGATAAAWPFPVHAQQGDRMRRIAVLAALAEDDPQMQEWLAAFRQAIGRLGWPEGQNVRVDVRFSGGKTDQLQVFAKELVGLRPDVMIAHTTPVAVALQRESRTIPIVFLYVSDPVGSGFVASLARPGGNLTGLLLYEASIAGKWLAMLKEIAPRTARAALVADADTPVYDYFLRAAQAAAPSLAIELVPTPIKTGPDIERALESFARAPNGGIFLPPNATTVLHRDLVIALAARLRQPAVYAFRIFVVAGGLMSYGTDQIDIWRQTASYVDRILRGAKPADLPVQAPTKYETILNLKTAKALGFEVPPSLLVRADEVIE